MAPKEFIRSASNEKKGASKHSKPNVNENAVFGKKYRSVSQENKIQNSKENSRTHTENLELNTVNPLREEVSKKALKMHVDDLSSDDEVGGNTIGNVPREWYADYEHRGYDLSGKPIAKSVQKDGIDRFLASQDDPNFLWTIYDSENDEEVVLSKRDVQIINKMRSGDYAHPEFDETSMAYCTTDVFASEVEIHPLHSGTEPKRRFLPSRHEAIRINRIVRAIRAGKVRYSSKPQKPEAHLLWGDDDNALHQDNKYLPPHLPAPKALPPGHAHSYNPPAEYLMTPEEEAQWHAAAPSERTIDFIPRKYSSLRAVPLHQRLIKERFERCLDLYLCPRAPMKRNVRDASSLLPELPDLEALRPYPTHQAQAFSGHTGPVRCLSISPCGLYVASGGIDGLLLVHELATGRVLQAVKLEALVAAVQWNPRDDCAVIAAAVDEKVLLMPAPRILPHQAQYTFDLLSGKSSTEESESEDADEEDEEEEPLTDDEKEQKENAVPKNSIPLKTAKWETLVSLKSPLDLLPQSMHAAFIALRRTEKSIEKNAKKAKKDNSDDEDEDDDDEDDEDDEEDLLSRYSGSKQWAAVRAELQKAQPCVSITHPYPIKRLSFHVKGDYLVSTAPSAPAGAAMVHRLSTRKSVSPLPKSLGQLQHCVFHPLKPVMYVATQRSVFVLDLASGAISQKLQAGVQWISTIAAHPNGNTDHLLCGSYDHRVVWFDAETGDSPFKTFRYHTGGVRAVGYHQRYPLMVTAGDDGGVHVFHAKVFTETYDSPVVVPVKILRGHEITQGVGVIDAAFHPVQPWLLTAGADGKLLLWQNLQ